MTLLQYPIPKIICGGVTILKKIFLMFFLLLAPNTSFADVRMAIMDFTVNGSAPHLGEATAEILRALFSSNTSFNVVERTRLEALAKEQKLQLSGLIDEETAVKAGKLLGANFIIVGSVNSFGSIFVLTARVIDVQKGTSISGFKYDSQGGRRNTLSNS